MYDGSNERGALVWQGEGSIAGLEGRRERDKEKELYTVLCMMVVMRGVLWSGRGKGV